MILPRGPFVAKDLPMKNANRTIVGVLFLILAPLLLWPPASRAADPVDKFDPEPVITLFELLLDSNGDPETTKNCLGILTGKIQSGELTAEQVATLKPRLEAKLAAIIKDDKHALHLSAVLLAASWKNDTALGVVKQLATTRSTPADKRLAALVTLLAVSDPAALEIAATIISDKQSGTLGLRGDVLNALSKSESPAVATLVLAAYAKLEPQLQPRAIQLVTQRPAWAKALLNAIGRNEIPANALDANQVAGLQNSKDAELVSLVTAKWGKIRTERNPEREKVVQEMKQFIRQKPGDPHRGWEVFKKVCGQCHKIHGEGQEVGPDITGSGRNDFIQLLSNVFDPSLVIGVAYQARQVRTSKGQVLTGLVAEESDKRVVLKLQGGKLEIVPTDEIEDMKTSELSLMPEGLEKQLQPEEIRDLFAFLILDKPPTDPNAKRLPGVYEK